MDIQPKLYSFGSFFKSTPRLMIPRFQREYSWEESNYKQYLDDMYHCLSIENGDLKTSDYFLGNMLFVPQNIDNPDNSIWDVIDGQQRLTTITILLSALAKTFAKNKETKLQAERIFDLYILPHDDDNEPQRIVRTKTSYPFFSNLIQDKEFALSDTSDEKSDSPNSEEEIELSKAYKFFLKAFEEARIRKDLSNQLNPNLLNSISYKDILTKIREQVLDTQFISIIVNSRSESYRLFESLNSKGKPLSNVDMVKNALFELLSQTEPSDFASDKWNELHKNLAGTSISLQDFYFLFWNSRYKYVSEKRLYEAFKKDIEKTTSSYKDFLTNLVDASELFKEIVNPNLKYFKNKREFQPFIDSIKRIESELSIRQARYISIALYDAYKRKVLKCQDLKKVGILLEDFLFAYTSITSGRANRYAGRFSSFARELHATTKRSDAIKLIKELSTDLAEKYPSKDQFIAGYKKLIYSSKGIKASECMKTKYALRRLSDYYASNNYNLAEPTIEHIMPDNSNTPSISIGNLLLIEGPLNKEADRNNFSKKLNIFTKSKNDLVKNFVKKYQNCSEWNEEQISKRTEILAELTYDSVLTSFKK